MKNIEERKLEVIAEYAANVCRSKVVADVFGVSEERVKDAIDRLNWLRRVEDCLSDGDDDTNELDQLCEELAEAISQKTIREIADEYGYELVETTSDRTGYPRNVQYAITGFETEEEAQELASKEGLMLLWIDRRDGWQLWHRGNPFSHSVNLDPEDIGAILFARTEEDIYSNLRDDLVFFAEEIDGCGEVDLDELKKRVENCKKALDEIATKEDCEAVPFFEGCGFDDAVKVDGVMGWYYDTKHCVVAAVRDIL